MCDAQVLADLEPCGFVLATRDYKYFALQCIYCQEKYGHWATFMRHVKEQHQARESLYWGTEMIEEENLEKNNSYVQMYDRKNQSDEVCEDVVIELANKSNTELSSHEWDSENMEIEEILPEYFGDDSSADMKERQEVSTSDTKQDFVEIKTNSINTDNELAVDALNSISNDDTHEIFSNSDSSQNDFDVNVENDEEDSDSGDRSKFVINFGSRNKSTCDFIECYRQHPCLWNAQLPEYIDAEARSYALKQIKAFYWENYNIAIMEKDINAAMKRLLIFYKRYCGTRRKINATRKYYFDRCSFLSGIELDERIQIKNISSKKLSFEQTDKITLGFINLCKVYSILWDPNHIDYSSYNERKKTYQHMRERIQKLYEISFSNEELYDCIYRLKQCYYNAQDKERRNEPLSKTDLVYLERCRFLPPCKRKVQCHICDRTLRSDMTLQIHLLKEHNIGQLPHKCGYCDTRFAHRTAMKEHEVRMHTKQFEWFCKHCLKGFAIRRDMELHELVHTGERNCICEQCGKGFRLKHQMMEHVKIVHDRIRRYKCTMCPKDYLRKSHLDDHIRGHLNIRDKVCPTCGKAFTNFHALFRHKQLHSEVKRYECKICGESFHQYVGLNGHMKRRHKVANKSNPIEEVSSTEMFNAFTEI